METIIISLSQLRGMIGEQVIHQGHRCLVVEVLEQSTELVLQIEEQHTIQSVWGSPATGAGYRDHPGLDHRQNRIACNVSCPGAALS